MSKPWTARESDRLKLMVAQGVSANRAAAALNRKDEETNIDLAKK